MLKGTTSFGVVLTWGLEVLVILKGGGGHERLPPFKRGRRIKFYPVLKGAAISFGPEILRFFTPPSSYPLCMTGP